MVWTKGRGWMFDLLREQMACKFANPQLEQSSEPRSKAKWIKGVTCLILYKTGQHVAF